MKETKNKLRKSKYKGLILSILFFIILIITILAANFYGNNLTARDTAQIEQTGKMRDQIQSVTRDLFDLSINYGESPFTPNIHATLDRLEENSKDLTNMLSVFQNGGLINQDGRAFKINPPADQEERDILNQAVADWQPLQIQIEQYLATVYDKNVDETPLALAILQAQTSSVSIYDELDELAEHVAIEAAERAKTIGYIQIAGIVFAIIYFLIFIFFFVRRLRRADSETEEARQETTEIMDTIQEGLFLIDADLNIGMQQSKELSEILPVENIAGRSLDDVIGNMINETDLTNTRRFINQLFNKRVKENLLDDLNPLRQVKTMVTDKNKRIQTRYLHFKFNRVYNQKQIIRVLVTVSDITESVKLQQLLEHERQQNKEQTEMLIKVLHLDQDLLSGFVRRTTQITQRVNSMLKTDGSSQNQLRKKLNDIFREVHSFKGEASALEFDSFVAIAEEAEDKLKQLRGYERLTGNDFMGVTVVLDRLIGLNEEIAEIQTRLASFSGNSIIDPTDKTTSSIIHNMDNFAEQIAARQNKQVELITTGFDQAQSLPQQTEDCLREIVTQLLRNAIVHGIETPQARKEKDKKPTGNIAIDYKILDGRAEISIQDDGRGIDFDALREKLRHDVRYKGQDIDNISEKMLYRVLFLPGFSTANTTQDAGRGEGMGIVRDRIKQLPQGKIAINSIAEHFTRFVISFALPNTGE